MTGKHDKKHEMGICPLCGGELYPGTTIMAFDNEHEQVIVVRGIPADVCAQCTEAYSFRFC
jgi:YgiT-type zinc finger domain-containing protein